jgi:hypothetical protein
MIHKKMNIVAPHAEDNHPNGERLTYWRSSPRCFSIIYKGTITEICVGDIGYGEMDRLDGAIHAAIGCKREKNQDCPLREV